MGGPSGGTGADAHETIDLVIESRFEELEQVHALIEDLGRRHGIDEDTVNALLIAVIEAGTNAIQHGNLFARDKSVQFHFRVAPDEVVVRVEDYGAGFDPSQVEDPTEEDLLMSPHGRGLYLMRSLMDEVTFEIRPDQGTTVRLRKARLPREGTRG